ncbi:MAG TPA: enoyl-CoA hydratase, partial [Gammaproteobacteria bacterium]|nr:enoyl-CoA hydratase [Gammaproteobacteria bacterium]
LSRNISRKRAFEMLITAKFIGAETALDWGLINTVVPDDALDDAVQQKLNMILSKSVSAIRFGKSMFHRQRQMPVRDAYEYAADVMANNMMEKDACEGVDAFLEKRDPVWT